MTYCLVEDIGSGYDFYVSINKNILNDKLKIITSHGIGNMIKIINNLNFKSNDTVIMAMDYISTMEIVRIIEELPKT